MKLNLDETTDKHPFLEVAVGILLTGHQPGTSMIKVIMKELSLIFLVIQYELKKVINPSISSRILLPV